ncbi:uncharacterized protein F4812DRAFT_415306 [Daldinia caldariorum]|uniref:uncharacterized protein n=1 Tax=Daldinia caldariorum TaxID=326644 RepID=UPI0020080EE0|nr:uncharacterized protein F4812DRAFT_415306 [Daldinia caldariorum]KAI1471750.1 hypothetical protein F4812DRAFT_415306 [Daldinia caldariorum]
MSGSSSFTDGATTTRDSFSNPANRVTLQVGERRFTTLRDTLIAESTYFAARLSAQWGDADADADADGSYFVDADPALFEHVLAYLRSAALPMFFDSASLTFDQARYAALLGAARYFGVRRLAEWIEGRKYVDAVAVTRTVVVDDDVSSASMHAHMSGAPAGSKVDLAATWGTKKVYVCPHDIASHHGNSLVCGCGWAKRREEGDEFKDELVLRAVVTITTATINPDRCLGRGMAWGRMAWGRMD